nr:hypothetical protein [Thioalkalivibrio sp. ALE23]
MSQRWLKLLERLASPLGAGTEDPDAAPPVEGQTVSEDWRDYMHHERLYRLYGPHPEGPWRPYHCPTLFAGIDRLKLQPHEQQLHERIAAERPPGTWDWLRPDTLTVVDLPGGLSVQMAATLFAEGTCQLIATFDHWPRANSEPAGMIRRLDAEPTAAPPHAGDPRIMVDSREVVNAMVTMAPRVAARWARGVPADAPPVWVCDARRLTHAEPEAGDYDNRYFIDDSILPGPERLRSAGIARVVHVAADADATPEDDLANWLHELYTAGFDTARMTLGDPETWVIPMPIIPAPGGSIAGRVNNRSDRGGFGQTISERGSSGGVYSGAGAGG